MRFGDVSLYRFFWHANIRWMKIDPTVDRKGSYNAIADIDTPDERIAWFEDDDMVTVEGGK